MALLSLLESVGRGRGGGHVDWRRGQLTAGWLARVSQIELCQGRPMREGGRKEYMEGT